MKKMISVFVAMAFMVWQTTSVGAYGDHDGGSMGSPSIDFSLDNSISADQKTASASTWISVPTGTNTYVSAYFLWENWDTSPLESTYLAAGHDGAVTVSPPALRAVTGEYYCVSSYHSITYYGGNGGTYMNTLYTSVP